MTDAETLEGRSPESLSRLERAWLKRRVCGWCEAPGHINACYAMQGSQRINGKSFRFPPRCTEQELDARRATWLEEYQPRSASIIRGEAHD